MRPYVFDRICQLAPGKAQSLITHLIPYDAVRVRRLGREGSTKQRFVMGITPNRVGGGCSEDGQPRGAKECFYLKVYRSDGVALRCVQKWLDVIGEFEKPYVYIVCDSSYLKRQIITKCKFPSDGHVEFMRSRKRGISKQCSRLHTKSLRWRNATFAHVAPFYHAKEHGCVQHWDIDADDTMFLLSPKDVHSAMLGVEEIAKKEDINALSLDMWHSRTRGRYWTFGVVYVNDSVDFCGILDDNEDLSWMAEFERQKLEKFYNADWFFTYLGMHGMANVGSFYVDNSRFIHWGANPIYSPNYGAVYSWSRGRLTYPILMDLFGDEEMGEVEIADCHCVDIGLQGDEFRAFLRVEFGRISDYERNRFGLPDHA